ncbi:hypothetical protein AB0L36_10760, partial [Streptomyces collinus]
RDLGLPREALTAGGRSAVPPEVRPGDAPRCTRSTRGAAHVVPGRGPRSRAQQWVDEALARELGLPREALTARGR